MPWRDNPRHRRRLHACAQFQGADGFDYTITSTNGVYHDTAVLDVR